MLIPIIDFFYLGNYKIKHLYTLFSFLFIYW